MRWFEQTSLKDSWVSLDPHPIVPSNGGRIFKTQGLMEERSLVASKGILGCQFLPFFVSFVCWFSSPPHLLVFLKWTASSFTLDSHHAILLHHRPQSTGEMNNGLKPLKPWTKPVVLVCICRPRTSKGWSRRIAWALNSIVDWTIQQDSVFTNKKVNHKNAAKKLLLILP